MVLENTLMQYTKISPRKNEISTKLQRQWFLVQLIGNINAFNAKLCITLLKAVACPHYEHGENLQHIRLVGFEKK